MYYKIIYNEIVFCSGTFRGNLECYRVRHNKICQVTKSADTFIKHLIGVGLTASIVNTCLILYAMISTPEILTNTMPLIVNCFWLATSFFYLLVMAVGAALVNHVVRMEERFNI